MTILQTARPVAFLYASDRKRALEFYCGTLGFAHRSADDFGDTIDLGDALARLTVLPDYKAGAHPVFGWDVADISAAVDGLRYRGVSFTIYEGMGQDARGIWASPDGGAHIAWFADPDGNVLSLSQIS